MPIRSARAKRERIGIRVAADDTWSDIFSRILTERIEPHLGIGRPLILYDYPASEAALARRKPSDPRLAERFELYVAGVELANAFGELTDPVEQRRRFEADMAEKQRIYGERYPLDEDFLAALAKMPPASGCALGLDRLVMLATGAERIDQVIWTPMPQEECIYEHGPHPQDAADLVDAGLVSPDRLPEIEQRRRALRGLHHAGHGRA